MPTQSLEESPCVGVSRRESAWVGAPAAIDVLVFVNNFTRGSPVLGNQSTPISPHVKKNLQISGFGHFKGIHSSTKPAQLNGGPLDGRGAGWKPPFPAFSPSWSGLVVDLGAARICYRGGFPSRGSPPFTGFAPVRCYDIDYTYLKDARNTQMGTD